MAKMVHSIPENTPLASKTHWAVARSSPDCARNAPLSIDNMTAARGQSDTMGRPNQGMPAAELTHGTSSPASIATINTAATVAVLLRRLRSDQCRPIAIQHAANGPIEIASPSAAPHAPSQTAGISLMTVGPNGLFVEAKSINSPRRAAVKIGASTMGSSVLAIPSSFPCKYGPG